jgi:hypothetical protein
MTCIEDYNCVLSLSCVYADDNFTCAGDKMDFATFVFVAAFQFEEATPQTHNSLHPCLLLNSCCCNIKQSQTDNSNSMDT